VHGNGLNPRLDPPTQEFKDVGMLNVGPRHLCGLLLPFADVSKLAYKSLNAAEAVSGCSWRGRPPFSRLLDFNAERDPGILFVPLWYA